MRDKPITKQYVGFYPFSGFNLNQNNVINSVDHIMFALPSYALSKILRRSQSSDETQEQRLGELATTLNHIRWVDVAVANVEFGMSPTALLPKFGFGHLVPASEPSKVLGVVYDSCSFPQHDRYFIVLQRSLLSVFYF